ncbi:AAA family ATPase [Marixanthomonas spongiae]|uniref:ATPase n=1 Tax=Marixanthomonas spongiae TaxID=2174845 RepID=A0A2U0HYH7_9FLAO|nr:ATP-binding protein [Marixanthomonas spongiae]PVW13931.1 ATPase [Marixanthomonas spongiae]
MKTKRIVITGGPGTGKTTLIDALEKKGYHCLPEVSREITKQAQQKGVEQLFLTDPILFSKRLLEGRLQQFKDANQYEAPFLFYDRGLPDVTAYMDYAKTAYPESFTNQCEEHRYDSVFLLPPWKNIYKQDNERYESFEEAEKIHTALLKGYENYGYDVQLVPVGTVEDRISYILDNLKQAR